MKKTKSLANELKAASKDRVRANQQARSLNSYLRPEDKDSQDGSAHGSPIQINPRQSYPSPDQSYPYLLLLSNKVDLIWI